MPICPGCSQEVSGPPVEAAKPPYHFLRCGACDLVFTDPMPSPDGDWYRRQEMYLVRDTVAKPRLQWNHRQFLRDLPGLRSKKAQPSLRTGSCSLDDQPRLLDVGCGTGEFVAAAKKAGYEASGFDFDEEAVRTAREQLGLKEVHSGDLRRLAEFVGRFDVVTAFEVLEHSPVPKEFLEAVAAAVKPGGYLALSVPNRERWPRFRYDWDFPPNHLTRWSRASLTRLLEKNGFQIRRTANGWKQGESLLHQHLQFGLVTRLLHGGKKQEAAEATGNQSSMALASGAYRLKSAAIRCLAVPVNIGLGLIGETGMTLYILALKKDGR